MKKNKNIAPKKLLGSDIEYLLTVLSALGRGNKKSPADFD